MIDISYTKTMTDDEINEDTELRQILINELKNMSSFISQSTNDISTRDLLVLYNTAIKLKG